MKILVIHNHYLENGGEDEVVSAEVKLLEDHGHKVVLYEKSNKDIYKLPFLKRLFYFMFDLNFSKTVYDEIKNIIRTEKPDIAHIHNTFICITPSAYFALKVENIPIVQTLHNYRFICQKGTFFTKGSICEKCKKGQFIKAVPGRCWRNSFVLSFFLSRLLYSVNYFFKNIDSYIVLSEFSKGKFIEYGLDRQKIYLKTNFLTREPGGRIQDHNYVLFIGRLVDYKGVKTLIKAFKINPFFNLKIIGDGPLRREVSDLASSYNNVEWLGRSNRDFVFEAIRNSSFVVFPSECYENMPFVIMESLAFSKPVLASNLGAIKELVIDGVNGILFEPGNEKDLADKISYMLSRNSERIDMGKMANKIYKERFNREQNYGDLMNIYMKTINLNKSLTA